MNEPSFETMRAAMVDSQLRTAGVSDPRVIEAFATVPRERFVPPEKRMFAYIDEDIPIAPGRTLTEPMVFARIVHELQVEPDERVLVIGAGTGYSAAILSLLASEVVAVESDPALAAVARETLRALGCDNVRLVEGELEEGAPQHAPYDVMLLDGAVEVIPDALLAQVREGGRVGTVLVEPNGVGRGVTGAVAGGSFGAVAFMDAAVGRLPGFARPRGFVF